MKITANGSHFELTSGKRFYANMHTLGLSLDTRYPGLRHGYDGTVEGGDDTREDWWDADDRVDHAAKLFKPSERAEIAEAMIARWTQWAETGR